MGTQYLLEDDRRMVDDGLNANSMLQGSEYSTDKDGKERSL